jgi:hypothetical protein
MVTKTLPVGYRTRCEEIYRIADELHRTFVSGNRKDLAAGLAELDGPAALAVLATILGNCGTGDREAICRFLVEMA